MSKLIRVAWIAVLLFPAARAQRDHFSKYKTVEAHEIRPGILMMPRYTDDGRVCEIGLEPLRYTPEKVNIDPSLSRQTIDQIVDELAPAAERGPKTKLFGGADAILYGGLTSSTNVDYENISVEMVNRGGPYKIVRRRVSNKSRGASDPSEYIAVVIRWNNRHCRITP
jgi:hypothetical protein